MADLKSTKGFNVNVFGFRKHLFWPLALLIFFQNCTKYRSSQSEQGLASEFTCREKVVRIPPRLISKMEYIYSVEDLLGLKISETIKAKIPPSPQNLGFDTNMTQSLDAKTINTFFEIATHIAEEKIHTTDWEEHCNNPENVKAWKDCEDLDLFRIATRAFRQPVSEFESQFIESIFEQASVNIDQYMGPVLGHFDVISENGQISGWAYDPRWEGRTVEIHFYVDGPAESGKFVGRTWTHFARPDVNAHFGIQGNHGFKFQLDPMLADEEIHSVFVYAIGSPSSLIAGSGKSFQSRDFDSNQVIAKAPSIFLVEGYKNALIKILTSPQFLFNATSLYLNPYQKAARLSSLITRSVPDEKLLKNAPQLNSDTILEMEQERLLDLYSERFVNSFFGQLVGYRDIEAENEIDLPLLKSFKTESLRVNQKILSDNLPLRSLFSPGFTFVDHTLAQHYGIVAPDTSNQEGHFIPTDQRGGVLSQGSFYRTTASASPNTEVIRRGRMVLSKFLCEDIPAPSPELFDQISEAKSKIDPSAPLIEQMAMHRNTSTACYTCHQKMDPIGLGLQNFDSDAIWRENYLDGSKIDSKGKFLGWDFSSPTQLSELLVADPQFPFCMQVQLRRYASVNSSSCDNSGIEPQGFRDLIKTTFKKIINSEEGRL